MSSIFAGIVTALSRLGGGAIEVGLGRYARRVKEIRRECGRLASLQDEELKCRAGVIRERVRGGTSLDAVLIETFAIVNEAAKRAIGLEPYDEQLMAGVALHGGKLVEMQTGEGKTLAAVFPAVLHALQGRGVHVLTFNDYLASRDAEWMGTIYDFFGLSVRHVQQGMTPDERRAAYASDVTYVTAKEAGFDFLRDRMCREPHELVQRGFSFAIIDEADSILIDEARVPLVIAAAAEEHDEDLIRYAELVSALRPGVDFETDWEQRNIQLTSTGLDRLERELECGDLHTEANVPALTRINLALQAHTLLHRDVDYIVRDGAILLIDELTGRVAENRRWPYGLQAAIEAKEWVPILPQGKILNSITLQHFLEQYELMSGMTGTAQEAAIELHKFYGLKVVVIPPHRPSIRFDHPDRVFPTKETKSAAVVREIAAAHRNGQPVLVGTASVEESERLAALLIASGIASTILNAKHDCEEAAVIAEAGAVGTVTISTNMAGRGTDIRLGGRDERERERVVRKGGLLVLETNRHESRRIDNQLRGRAGRQGDPGETRFLISLEDDLLRRHGISDASLEASDEDDDSSEDDSEVGKEISHIQHVIEGECFEIRKTLREYSYCLERHRQLVEERRQSVLFGSTRQSVLQEQDPDLHERLTREFGAELVQKVERQVTLCQIDRAWSDHLAVVAEVRDGIHLVSLCGLNPFDEFNRQINSAFRDCQHRIDAETVETLRRVEITRAGIDLEREGLLGPSSTWTYMINDNPAGEILQRLQRGLKRWVTGQE